MSSKVYLSAVESQPSSALPESRRVRNLVWRQDDPRDFFDPKEPQKQRHLVHTPSEFVEFIRPELEFTCLNEANATIANIISDLTETYDDLRADSSHQEFTKAAVLPHLTQAADILRSRIKVLHHSFATQE
jgi:hypothetical protein